MTRLGYQIPNFTYPGIDQSTLFDVVASQAREADRSGFDTVLVMDHFYQLPMLGEPDQYMLECYSLLSALARETDNVLLSALVTGNTYRNPAVLAKTVTTLDVVSGGRAMLGIGAGWYELEHQAFGLEFGTFTDRFERLEEALQIIVPMLEGQRPSLDGHRYVVSDAINEPLPISKIPVMIGGGGEKKTLRMVAQYADESNIICAPDEIDRKLDALAGHSAALERDRSELTVSWQKTACIAPTREQAKNDLFAYFERRGLSLAGMSDDEQNTWLANFVWGGPDDVGEAFDGMRQDGIDGFTVNMPANGHIEGRVELLGTILAPIVLGS